MMTEYERKNAEEMRDKLKQTLEEEDKGGAE